ncbi:MAG: radical SAM family heme chaperone HemW [Chloroflexi bacterium]|nr:radical SAM family heme chaperone HemW [Chloroflexota bacterium]
MIGVSKNIALYLHIPFCRRKCGYCSFTSYACRQADIPAYLRALKAELAQRTNGESVSSIYFGGGTPSLLMPEQIRDVLDTVHTLFKVDKGTEITTEANPGTVDEAYLRAIRALGVNRLSLGVQSLNDSELNLLGRIHTAAEARTAVRSARSAGFDNLNLDLIYGLPGQNLASWRETLKETIDLNPEHLSLYALTLEEGTSLYQAIEENRLPWVDPDVSADQYELAEDLLEKSGYKHYEISNWAKPGYECRHNLVYWHNGEYLGVGVAAHSSLNGHRLSNTSNLDEYLAAFANGLPFSPEMDEEIGVGLQLAETVILGLRLDEGINLNQIQNCYGVDVVTTYRHQVEEMTEAGLLECTNGYLKLTPRGRLLSNEVFWRLLPEEAAVKTG